jgi:hypothetical protein
MRRFAVFAAVVLLLTSVAMVIGQTDAPSGDDPGLTITVDNQSCGLTLADASAATLESTAAATLEATSEATPESTSEVSAPTAYTRLALGGDCYEVTPHLYVASNDVLWVAVALPNEPNWQHFSIDPADPHPPKLDRRGRFIGCSVPLEGTQTCRALWENFGTVYAIEIPISVGKAYYGPPPTNTPAATAVPVVPVSTPNNSGVWGSCGSCTTCGGPVEHCVLAPDNTCVWDAFRCERPNPQ